jgi:hypothetical protein
MDDEPEVDELDDDDEVDQLEDDPEPEDDDDATPAAARVWAKRRPGHTLLPMEKVEAHLLAEGLFTPSLSFARITSQKPASACSTAYV